jgi:hypothetical protein
VNVTITHDGRFDSPDYITWLLQDHSTRSGKWVPASAAGCVAQAMTVVSASAPARYRVVAGATEDWIFYVRDGVPLGVRLQDATIYESLVDAERARACFERLHFETWARDGKIRDWNIPFLEAVP